MIFYYYYWQFLGFLTQSSFTLVVRMGFLPQSPFHLPW